MEGCEVHKIAPGICMLQRSKLLKFSITLYHRYRLNHVWVCTWLCLVQNLLVSVNWISLFTIVFSESHFQGSRDVWTCEYASFWPPTETMPYLVSITTWQASTVSVSISCTLSNKCSFCICLELLTCFRTYRFLLVNNNNYIIYEENTSASENDSIGFRTIQVQ